MTDRLPPPERPPSSRIRLPRLRRSQLGDALRRALGRGPSGDDGIHAPGKRHVGPPPDQHGPEAQRPEPRRNQPWIRTSHSDSQRRRPRG